MATPKQQQPMSDEERQELINKLNAELEEHVSKLEKKPYKEGWSQDNWENEMNEHPLFRNEPLAEGELPPLLEALQQIKYDPNENTKEELAQNYKEDGNQNFKQKKYDLAIQAYTEGLKQKCLNNELNSILYANRAAANYHLGNLRSALKDAIASTNLKPDNMKAIVRGAMCLQGLKSWDDCINWCAGGLSIEANNKELEQIKTQALLEKRKADRDQRKKALMERKIKKEQEQLMEALKSRNIQLVRPKRPEEDEDGEMKPLPSEEFLHPSSGKAKLHLDKDGFLIWPVMFLYPEHEESDFIEEFHENARFSDHLEVMFGSPESRPGWDQDGKYTVENIQMYHKSPEGKLVQIDTGCTLSEAVYPLKQLIFGGFLEFLLISKESSFDIKCLENSY